MKQTLTIDLPEKIIRIDDGEIFSLNENGTYSLDFMKKRFSGHFTHEYSYETLMSKFTGKFKHA